MTTWAIIAILFVIFGFLFGAILAYALCRAAKMGDEKINQISIKRRGYR